MIKTPVLPAILLCAALGACQPAAQSPAEAPVEEQALPAQPAPPPPDKAPAPLQPQASDDWQV